MLGIKSDVWIKSQGNKLISPFAHKKVKTGVVSYGLSSYGYDVRLSPTNIQRLYDSPYVIDVKDDKSKECYSEIPKSFHGEYFVVHPNSSYLVTVKEKLTMPDNVMGFIFGKSTYARTGLIVNASPIEPGWVGHLTLNVVNTNAQASVKVYINEGIAQVVFVECEECTNKYSGKYQNQQETITHGKVEK